MIVTHLKLNDEIKNQINQCLNLVKEIFGQDLLGVYLYGSSILGGLQKYSDIDLLVVTNRASTYEEKTQLATQLLQISGVYMVSTKLPIEMTLVDSTIHSKTGFNGLLVVKALTPREWACVKHFRDTYFFGPHGIDDPYTWTFDHSEHAHLILYQGTEIIGYAHIQFWS